MRRLFEILVPLWLLGLIFPPTLDLEWKESLQAASALWLLPLGVLAGRTGFLYGPVFRQQPGILVASGALFVMLAVSSILCEDPLRSLGYTLLSLLVFLASAGIWELLDSGIQRSVFLYSVFGSVITGYIYWNAPEYSAAFQGRLSFEGSHPNHLGLVAFGVLGAALFVPNVYLRWILVGLNLLVIAAAQARGSFLAAIAAISVRALLLYCTDAKMRSRRTVLLAAGACIGASAILTQWDWVRAAVNDLFLLDDRYRGLGTGFTGRIEAWEEAFELFRANPVFGVGFRMHERYMSSLPSAHNGYLSMLADTGIMGSLATLALLVAAGFRVTRMALAGSGQAILAASFFAGYCVIAMFERFLINIGNPTSVLVWLLLFVPGEKIRVRLPDPHRDTRESLGDGLALEG